VILRRVAVLGESVGRGVDAWELQRRLLVDLLVDIRFDDGHLVVSDGQTICGSAGEIGVAMGNRFRTKFTRKWIPTVLAAVTAVGVLALPGTALGAEQHPSDADIGYTYNPDTQEIGFWFAEGEVDCEWSAEADVESAEEAETACFVLGVAGPNGQVNHGTIMSAFVHGLKDLMELGEYEGPRGQFISQVARGDHGKGDHQVNPSDDSDGEGHGPPAWVQEKKANRQNNGRGRGG
jgi:hypothetical protein